MSLGLLARFGTIGRAGCDFDPKPQFGEWFIRCVRESIRVSTARRSKEHVKSSNPETTITQTSIEEAFVNARPRLIAIVQKQLVPINTNAFTAVSIARAAVPQVIALRGQLEKLVDFDIVNVDNVEL